MNNEQFRRLIAATPSPSPRKNATSFSSPPKQSATSSLGSRLKPRIPMTPRSVAGLAGSYFVGVSHLNGNKNKRFRTSAPKGTKLASGYVDRAAAVTALRTRDSNDGDDDEQEAARIRELDEKLWSGKMDSETHARLRDGTGVGGDLASTHRVRGLDFKLLERVRRGEDVYGESVWANNGELAAAAAAKNATKKDENAAGGREEREDDVEQELLRLEAVEVKAVLRERAEKKGQLAPVLAGQKRSRNQLLAEMKAARDATRKKQKSGLGSKFKKIGVMREAGTRIKLDAQGREVMITVDEDGHETHKVRKVGPEAARREAAEREAFVPDENKEVLGVDVSDFYQKAQATQQAKEKEDQDLAIRIFDDAGSDYDPLAGLEGSDKEDSEVDEKTKSKRSASKEMPPPPKPSTEPSGPRNRFKDSKTGLTFEQVYKRAVDDASFMAALQRVKARGGADKSEAERHETGRKERLQDRLRNSSRDDEDIDFG